MLLKHHSDLNIIHQTWTIPSCICTWITWNVLFSRNSSGRQVLNALKISAIFVTKLRMLMWVIKYESYVYQTKDFACAHVTGNLLVYRTPFDNFQKVCISLQCTTCDQYQSIYKVAQIFQKPLQIISAVPRAVVVSVDININLCGLWRVHLLTRNNFARIEKLLNSPKLTMM